MVKPDPSCGGCRGEGRHKRWCFAVNGPYAGMVGLDAQRISSTGDHIGSNDPMLSNACWRLAKLLELHASEHADTWRLRHPDAPEH